MLSPELDFPRHKSRGAEGIGSSKLSCAEFTPGTLGLELRTLRTLGLGILGTFGEEGGTQLHRGSKILLARTRLVHGSCPDRTGF